MVAKFIGLEIICTKIVETSLANFDTNHLRPQFIYHNFSVKPKILLTWNAGHGMENLGGCRDWNCMVVNDKSKLNEADAVSSKNVKMLS